MIRHNYSEPFKVILRDNLIAIRKRTNNDNYEPYLSLTLENKRVFLPEVHNATPTRFLQPTTPDTEGNSVLVQLAPRVYLFIGLRIYIFKTTDEIVHFYSPIGNNDVPYPWAVGTQNTYLLIEEGLMDNTLVQHLGMPYWDYYERFNQGAKPTYRTRILLDSLRSPDMEPSTSPRCYRYNENEQPAFFYPPQLASSVLNYLH